MNEAFRKQLLDDLKKIDGFEDIGGISQDDNDIMNELLGFDLEEFEKGLNITNVPTFIFYKNGKEVNRIVESPRVSLEQDMIDIINGNNYKHIYIQ